MRPCSRFLAGLTLLLAACGGGASGPDPPRAPSLLLITVDTLRADALESYGAAPGCSPALAAFGASAVVFEDVRASSSWTLPTLASLMTGLFTTTHGCWTLRDSLDPSFSTLAEELQAAGWDTAAVVSHVFLGRPYGLDQGFTHYDDELVLEMSRSHEAISSPAITAKGVRFLQQKAAAADGRPWFLWLHYFDPHEVYQPHAGLSERWADEGDLGLYRGEVAWTDRHIGTVLEALDELGLADDVVVALTADHGEEFGEHGGTSHGKTLYVEVERVPLAIRAPGVAPRRVAERVRTVDVAPTLLELLGFPANEWPPGGRPAASPAASPGAAGARGQSLRGAMEGRALEPLPAVSELRRKSDRERAAIISGNWKLIRDPVRPQDWLFDLAADPEELENRAAVEHRTQIDLAERLDALRAEASELARGYRRPEARELSVAEVERMRDLGYVGDE